MTCHAISVFGQSSFALRMISCESEIELYYCMVSFMCTNTICNVCT